MRVRNAPAFLAKSAGTMPALCPVITFLGVRVCVCVFVGVAPKAPTTGAAPEPGAAIKASAVLALLAWGGSITTHTHNHTHTHTNTRTCTRARAHTCTRTCKRTCTRTCTHIRSLSSPLSLSHTLCAQSHLALLPPPHTAPPPPVPKPKPLPPMLPALLPGGSPGRLPPGCKNLHR